LGKLDDYESLVRARGVRAKSDVVQAQDMNSGKGLFQLAHDLIAAGIQAGKLLVVPVDIHIIPEQPSYVPVPLHLATDQSAFTFFSKTLLGYMKAAPRNVPPYPLAGRGLHYDSSLFVSAEGKCLDAYTEVPPQLWVAISSFDISLQAGMLDPQNQNQNGLLNLVYDGASDWEFRSGNINGSADYPPKADSPLTLWDIGDPVYFYIGALRAMHPAFNPEILGQLLQQSFRNIRISGTITLNV
jgi:hypothetical protein